MSQQILLDLPESVIKQAQTIADREGRSVNTLLVEWIERGVTSETMQPIVYLTDTPYGNEEAAKVMQEMIQASALPKIIKRP